MARATPTRRRLDRAAVIEAACRLLDEDGLEGFSMARLGDRLGVTAMALYRHVGGRRDLEAAVVEFVLGDLSVSDASGGHWEVGVEGWMRSVRRHWLEHPWLGGLLGTGTGLSPAWLVALDRLARTLEHAGLAADTVARELVRISRVTTGIIVLELAAPLPHAARFGDAIVASLPAAERPRWRPIVDALAAYGDDDLFDDIVDATLDRLRRSRAVGPDGR